MALDQTPGESQREEIHHPVVEKDTFMWIPQQPQFSMEVLWYWDKWKAEVGA